MVSIVGIRDGHRVTTTVTRHAGALAVDRVHHPECPCQPVPETSMDHTPTPTDSANPQDAGQDPTWTLQRWDWTSNTWTTNDTFTSSRGEDNAWFAVGAERASSTGPIRLLKNDQPVLEDDPATYYTQADW